MTGGVFSPGKKVGLIRDGSVEVSTREPGGPSFEHFER